MSQPAARGEDDAGQSKDNGADDQQQQQFPAGDFVDDDLASNAFDFDIDAADLDDAEENGGADDNDNENDEAVKADYFDEEENNAANDGGVENEQEDVSNSNRGNNNVDEDGKQQQQGQNGESDKVDQDDDDDDEFSPSVNKEEHQEQELQQQQQQRQNDSSPSSQQQPRRTFGPSILGNAFAREEMSNLIVAVLENCGGSAHIKTVASEVIRIGKQADVGGAELTDEDREILFKDILRSVDGPVVKIRPEADRAHIYLAIKGLPLRGILAPQEQQKQQEQKQQQQVGADASSNSASYTPRQLASLSRALNRALTSVVMDLTKSSNYRDPVRRSVVFRELEKLPKLKELGIFNKDLRDAAVAKVLAQPNWRVIEVPSDPPIREMSFQYFPKPKPSRNNKNANSDDDVDNNNNNNSNEASGAWQQKQQSEQEKATTSGSSLVDLLEKHLPRVLSSLGATQTQGAPLSQVVLALMRIPALQRAGFGDRNVRSNALQRLLRQPHCRFVHLPTRSWKTQHGDVAQEAGMRFRTAAPSAAINSNSSAAAAASTTANPLNDAIQNLQMGLIRHLPDIVRRLSSGNNDGPVIQPQLIDAVKSHPELIPLRVTEARVRFPAFDAALLHPDCEVVELLPDSSGSKSRHPRYVLKDQRSSGRRKAFGSMQLSERDMADVRRLLPAARKVLAAAANGFPTPLCVTRVTAVMVKKSPELATGPFVAAGHVRFEIMRQLLEERSCPLRIVTAHRSVMADPSAMFLEWKASLQRQQQQELQRPQQQQQQQQRPVSSMEPLLPLPAAATTSSFSASSVPRNSQQQPHAAAGVSAFFAVDERSNSRFGPPAANSHSNATHPWSPHQQQLQQNYTTNQSPAAFRDASRSNNNSVTVDNSLVKLVASELADILEKQPLNVMSHAKAVEQLLEVPAIALLGFGNPDVRTAVLAKIFADPGWKIESIVPAGTTAPLVHLRAQNNSSSSNNNIESGARRREREERPAPAHVSVVVSPIAHLPPLLIFNGLVVAPVRPNPAACIWFPPPRVGAVRR